MENITIEKLYHELERTKAVQACQNLMSAYSIYHTAIRHIEYMKLWSKREDCIFDAPWGIYDGYEGVARCYLEDHGDRSEPDSQLYYRGCMNFHHMDTSVVIVADDGETARGAWMSPGIETFNRPEIDPEPQALWAWSAYNVDFIKEDGEWRIWHMRLYPLFCAPFGTPWTQLKPYEGTPSLEDQISRKAPEKPWNWSKDEMYPVNQPYVPKPYRTFSDLGPEEMFYHPLEK